METSISDLPPHIITDILLRLPTESIIRSRFVSKTWCSLLSNPDFINFHHSRSPASLLFVCPPSPKLHILNLIELEDAIHGNNLRSNLQVRHPFKPGTCLVGAVSGLVCLFKYYPSEATYICNPATREYIILPQPKYTKEGYQLRSFGFGRSSTTGEYKVVRVFQAEKYPVAGTSHTVSEGEIYTIGNGTWKSIGHVPFILGFGFPPLFMNDNLHWLITNPESPEPVIYRFDVNTEVFQPVLLPPQLTQSNEGKWSLGVFGHCLCLCDNNSNSEIVIWRMKDYGVESSWTKEVVISKTPDQEWLSVGVGCVLRVLKDFEDGTILFSWWGKDLLCYNPDNKILEILDVFPHYFEATVYVSSVLSLKSFELENVQVF